MDEPMPVWARERWEDFLANKANPYDTDDDIHRELFDSDLCPLQRARELSLMLSLVREEVKSPVAIMEIGTDKCSTFYHWLRAFKHSLKKAIGVEIRGVPVKGLFERAFPQIQFLWIEGSSYSPETVQRVTEFMGDDRLDFLFLDGDKNNFLTDFNCYRPLLSSRALVAFHDVFDNGSPMQRDFQRAVKDYTSYGAIIDNQECDRVKAALVCGREPSESFPPAYLDFLKIWSYTSCGYGYIRHASRRAQG